MRKEMNAIDQHTPQKTMTTDTEYQSSKYNEYIEKKCYQFIFFRQLEHFFSNTFPYTLMQTHIHIDRHTPICKTTHINIFISCLYT